MYRTKSFYSALAASTLTSLLMLVDRIVLNILPLFFWSIEEVGAWVFIRAWTFILMSLEGGVGGRLSADISSSCKLNFKPPHLEKKVKSAEKKLFNWGGKIFLLNALFLYLYVMLDAPFFKIENRDVLIAILLSGAYSFFYYQTQTVVYAYRGIGAIAKGQMFANIVKTAEIIALIVGPYLGSGIIECMFSILLVRVLFSYIGKMYLYRDIKQIACIDEVIPKDAFDKQRIIMRIKVAYFLYPLYPALYNFLPLAFISIIISPLAVVQFSIGKLLGRFLAQISQVISRVLWPVNLHKSNEKEIFYFSLKVIKYYAMISIPCFFVLITAGWFLDGTYLKEVRFDYFLAGVLSLGSLLFSFNEVILSVFVAREAHFYPIVIRFAGLSITSLALFILDVRSLNVIAISLVFLEVGIFVFMLTVCFFWRKKINVLDNK